MSNFLVSDTFLILNKSVRQTKKDETGNSKKYGSMSVYCANTDEFTKIMIFDDYENVLARYETGKAYQLKLRISIRDGKTYINIL